jgi:hypothetical protein
MCVERMLRQGVLTGPRRENTSELHSRSKYPRDPAGAPSTALRISPACSDARKTAQLRLALQSVHSLGLAQDDSLGNGPQRIPFSSAETLVSSPLASL